MKRFAAVLGAAFLCAVHAFGQNATPNLNLNLPAFNSPNWNIFTNSNWSAVDNAIGLLQAPLNGSWSSTSVYTKGSQVTYGGSIWMSMINSNFNNTPQAGSSAWQFYFSQFLPPAYGSGAPAIACTAVNEGQNYYDTSTTPNTPYVCHSGSWGKTSGPIGATLPSAALVWALTSTTSRAATPADIAATEQAATNCNVASTVWSPVIGACIFASGSVSGTSGLPLLFNGTAGITFDPTQGGAAVPPLSATELPVPAPVRLLSNTWSAYESYGTSITFGTGATGGTGTMPYLSTQYTSLIAADMGLTPVTSGGTFTNHGIGQDEMADGVKHIFNFSNPTATDNTARTMEFGINDARHSGSGAYEDNFNMSARAGMSWLMIPVGQKSLASQYSGALPTNWTMDTTYAANSALTTSTNGANTSFCINMGTKTANPYWFIWYRRFDPGGATTPGTFSYTFNGVTHFVYTGTLFPMSTWNGATDSIGVVIIPAGTVSGNVCTTVTMVSTTGTTVSIFGLGAGPFYNASSVSLPLWITGVDRQTLDGQGGDPAQYNADQKANITMFQQMGFNQLYFANERNFWMSTNADMSPGNSPHPNNLGEIEIRNAFEAATPLMPSAPVNTGPTMPLRTITSATNCNISTTDVFVNFNIASDVSCSITSDGLFGNPMTTAVKHITLFNSAPHTVTISSGLFSTGVLAANTTTLAQNAVVDVYISPGIGAVIGPIGTVNIATGYPCTSYSASTVTVSTKDGCIVQTGPASVYTLPTTMVAGKSWLLFNSSSGAITFANNGLTASTIPGNSNALIVATTATTAVVAFMRSNSEAESVVFSATPTFNANILTSRMILTGGVTSFTLAGAQTDGQKKSLCFKQSGAGSLTVTPPANVHGFTAIGSTALTWSCQTFSWDNTDSIWLSTAPAQTNQ